MFGGAGLFRDGVMFGVLLNDVAYFRVDDALKADMAAWDYARWVRDSKRAFMREIDDGRAAARP